MVLEEFYKLLLEEKDFRKLHIPRSEIFYIRAAVEAKYGYRADTKEIELTVLDMYEKGELEVPKPLIKELKRLYRKPPIDSDNTL